MNLFIGIDVGKLNLSYCAINSDDQCLFQDEASNDLNGASQIKQAILAETKLSDYQKVIVGMEATSVYNFHPTTFLSEDQELQKISSRLLPLILTLLIILVNCLMMVKPTR